MRWLRDSFIQIHMLSVACTVGNDAAASWKFDTHTHRRTQHAFLDTGAAHDCTSRADRSAVQANETKDRCATCKVAERFRAAA